MNPLYGLVAERAGHRCEYCRAPEAIFNLPFEVEHIVPTSRGGADDESNRALACRSCNLQKQGLVTCAIAVAREKGILAYICDGLNRWPAVRLLDAAPVYRLALENGTTLPRYHAVAEEGVPAREIAQAIVRGLKIPVISMSPEEGAGHFGWLGFLAGMDMPASSALTQQRLGWRPTQKAGMIDDLGQMNWSAG